MTTTDMGRVLACAGEIIRVAVTHGPLLRYAAFQSVGEYIRTLCITADHRVHRGRAHHTPHLVSIQDRTQRQVWILGSTLDMTMTILSQHFRGLEAEQLLGVVLLLQEASPGPGQGEAGLLVTRPGPPRLGGQPLYAKNAHAHLV